MGAWGDDEEEEEFGRQETPVDPNTGIKTVTEYRTNAVGQRFKMTKQILVKEVRTREAKEIAARKARLQGRKFGLAKNCPDESNVTIVTNDTVTIQNPKEEDQDDAAQQSTVKASMNEFAKKQMMRKLKMKYGMDEGAAMPTMDEDEDDKEGGARSKFGALAGASGDARAPADAPKSYVPPGLRGTVGAGAAPGSGLARMAAYDDRDQATLRVTNISEDTTEADLQMLFAPYGRVARIYLAKDRETFVSRGFAFVSYINRADAARAMEELQGYGFDHLILKIEWAKPSNKEENSAGGLAGGFTSGYGKALAQDTKDKVSYASNLTGNK